jgi:3-oxoacyl-[acyl-carrier-protein] synthase-1
MIAVQAAGALTPVGLDLSDTMAALYTHVQLVEDLEALDNDGEPLSGMKIRFAEDIAGPARLLAMAHAVVDEATLTVEPEAKIPLILCCPEAAAFAESPADWPAQLLAQVISEAAFSVDRARSRIIARGRTGMIEALGTALALLKDSSIPYCLVGGVDSFVDADRVAALVDDDRILTGTNKDGFKPGEAGVVLLLTNRPDPDALASWLGAAAGTEEANRGTDRPITGTGLQEAMTKALAQAKLAYESLSCLAHDFSGEQRYFEELLLASSRLAKGSVDSAIEIPALSVGETGAAAGFLSIAMLAFLHSKGVHKRPSLAALTSDGPERGAVVLGPTNVKERHG